MNVSCESDVARSPAQCALAIRLSAEQAHRKRLEVIYYQMFASLCRSQIQMSGFWLDTDVAVGISWFSAFLTQFRCP